MPKIPRQKAKPSRPKENQPTREGKDTKKRKEKKGKKRKEKTIITVAGRKKIYIFHNKEKNFFMPFMKKIFSTF